MASQLERRVEIGLRICSDGELRQAAQARERPVSRDAPAAFGEEQGVAHFQVPHLGDERFRFSKSGEGGIRPRVLFVVEKPRYGDGRIENDRAQWR